MEGPKLGDPAHTRFDSRWMRVHANGRVLRFGDGLCRDVAMLAVLEGQYSWSACVDVLCGSTRLEEPRKVTMGVVPICLLLDSQEPKERVCNPPPSLPPEHSKDPNRNQDLTGGWEWEWV